MKKRILRVLFCAIALCAVCGGEVAAFAASPPAGNGDLMETLTTGKGIRAGMRGSWSEGIFSFDCPSSQDVFPFTGDLFRYGKFTVEGENREFSELPLYVTAKLTAEATDGQTWNGLGLLLGYRGQDYYLLRLQPDAGCHVIIYHANTGGETLLLTQYESPFRLEPGTSYVFEMIREGGKVTVLIDGQTAVAELDVPQLEGFGLYFCGVSGARAEDLSAWFTVPVAVSVEKPVEPEYPLEDPVYEYHTQELAPGGGQPVSPLVWAGGAIALVALAGLIVVVVLRRRIFK